MQQFVYDRQLVDRELVVGKLDVDRKLVADVKLVVHRKFVVE